MTVYYDPKDPSLAVLERGASFGGLVRVRLSALVVSVGLWILLQPCLTSFVADQ